MAGYVIYLIAKHGKAAVRRKLAGGPGNTANPAFKELWLHLWRARTIQVKPAPVKVKAAK